MPHRRQRRSRRPASVAGTPRRCRTPWGGPAGPGTGALLIVAAFLLGAWALLAAWSPTGAGRREPGGATGVRTVVAVAHVPASIGRPCRRRSRTVAAAGSAVPGTDRRRGGHPHRRPAARRPSRPRRDAGAEPAGARSASRAGGHPSPPRAVRPTRHRRAAPADTAATGRRSRHAAAGRPPTSDRPPVVDAPGRGRRAPVAAGRARRDAAPDAQPARDTAADVPAAEVRGPRRPSRGGRASADAALETCPAPAGAPRSAATCGPTPRRSSIASTASQRALTRTASGRRAVGPTDGPAATPPRSVAPAGDRRTPLAPRGRLGPAIPLPRAGTRARAVPVPADDAACRLAPGCGVRRRPTTRDLTYAVLGRPVQADDALASVRPTPGLRRAVVGGADDPGVRPG